MPKSSQQNSSNKYFQSFQDWDPVWIIGPTGEGDNKTGGLIVRGFHINGEDVHPSKIIEDRDLARQYGRDSRVTEYASRMGLIGKLREHGVRVRLPKTEEDREQKQKPDEDEDDAPTRSNTIKARTAAAIRAAREAKGQTQKEFAVACGVPATSLRRYETGKGTVQPEYLDKIAKYVGSAIPR